MEYKIEVEQEEAVTVALPRDAAEEIRDWLEVEQERAHMGTNITRSNYLWKTLERLRAALAKAGG